MRKRKSTWFLWVLLFFLPPVGIIYMWVSKKEFSAKKKVILSIIFAIWFVLCLSADKNNTSDNSIPSVNTQSLTETETTENAEEQKNTEITDNTEYLNSEEESIDTDIIKKDLTSLFDSLIDDTYKTSSEYSCDILTSDDYDSNATISVQMESADFSDQDACVAAVSEIMEGALNSECYKSIKNLDFNMLSNGSLQYIIHIEDAQAITSMDNITENLAIQKLRSDEAASTEQSNDNAQSVTAENTSSDDTSTITAPVETTPTTDMVWISRTGKKYHRNSSCSNMKNPSQVTKSEAEAMGLTPCKKCY